MTDGPELIVADNLSNVWARAFDLLMAPGTREITPLILTACDLAGQPEVERLAIRTALDDALRAQGKQSVYTVASTIFPRSLWNPAQPRARLYERYERILPRLYRASARNGNGLYFERLTRYPSPDHAAPHNQLEYIIRTFQGGNHRRSALQASVLVPGRDQTDQRQRGFPCLQQVQFGFHGATPNLLTVTGLYANQLYFEKAYGNLLGLYDLGRFVAAELSLTLDRVTCIAGIAQLGAKKRTLQPLHARLHSLLHDTAPTP